MGAPPLHRSFVPLDLPSNAGALHLPDLQQGLLKAFKSQDPQPLTHWREAVQVPTQRLRQGLQRPKQHETARTWLPHRRWQHVGLVTTHDPIAKFQGVHTRQLQKKKKIASCTHDTCFDSHNANFTSWSGSSVFSFSTSS